LTAVGSLDVVELDRDLVGPLAIGSVRSASCGSTRPTP
jgi:hypothetical protein